MPVPPRSTRLLVTLLVAVPWLMVGMEWLLVLPRFARLFDQYGLRLPSVSHAIVSAVRWAGENFFIAGWAYLMCIILSMSGVNRLMNRDLESKVRNRRLLVVFAIPVFVFVASWLGIHHPYSKLMQGLGR